jgi:sec-independent protein translocase protein TatC
MFKRRGNLPDNPNNLSMSLGDHLEELRTRLILAIAGFVIALIVCMVLGTYLIAFIEKPYNDAMGPDAHMQSMGPADGIMSYMWIAAVAAIVVSSPWIFYQLWQFIAAGLYPRERRYVHIAVPFSSGLFIAGALFFFFIIAPLTLRYFKFFNENIMHLSNNFAFSQYVSFVGMMMLVFGVAFQTPIAIFCLEKIGLVSLQSLTSIRKYVVLVIVVLASAAIPGSDPISLFALAGPMYLLYELGILLSRVFGRKTGKTIFE